jgi:hypothetical protein
MTRRTFLILGGIAAVGASVMGWRLAAGDSLAALLSRAEGIVRSPAARLRRHYAWLAIDPAAIDSYVADYGRAFRLWRFSALPADFYTRFLLSTDFFAIAAGPAAPTRPVRYTRFYDPDDRWCHNPLAGAPPGAAPRGGVG